MRTVLEIIVEGDHTTDEAARRGVMRAFSNAYEGHAVCHVTIVKEEVGTAYEMHVAVCGQLLSGARHCETERSIMGMVNAVFADAKETTACERCEAEPGEPCVDDSRKAHPIGTIHLVRLNTYRAARKEAGKKEMTQ